MDYVQENSSLSKKDKNNFEFSQLFQNRKKVKGKCRLKSEEQILWRNFTKILSN